MVATRGNGKTGKTGTRQGKSNESKQKARSNMAPCIGRRCVARAGGARGIGVGGAWTRQRETLTTQRLGRATAGRVQLAKLLERQKKPLGLGLCVAASAQSEKDETGATGEGDVYLVDTKPLSEGVKKHTVLIFVTDESG